jgi:hypothetical protein
VQSWVPLDEFGWVKEGKLKTVRTSAFGSRRFCGGCGAVMAIVYDEFPDEVWVAAGSLDEGCGGWGWDRVVHICCEDRPGWIELREDGLERIAGAQ